MSDLLALAARVEALTGPCRNCDAMIHYALNNGVGVGYASDAPLYTASLDAALTLVPEGCLFTARTLWDGPIATGYAVVSCYEANPDKKGILRFFLGQHEAEAATPALALTAASLRARAAMEESK